MAEKPQFYQEFKWASQIDVREAKLRSVISQLEGIKTDLETIKTEVDADPTPATSDMITLATQANGLVNHATFTGFLSFLHTNLD